MLWKFFKRILAFFKKKVRSQDAGSETNNNKTSTENNNSSTQKFDVIKCRVKGVKELH